MEDFITNDPVLAADARMSGYLLMACQRHPKCREALAALRAFPQVSGLSRRLVGHWDDSGKRFNEVLIV